MAKTKIKSKIMPESSDKRVKRLKIKKKIFQKKNSKNRKKINTKEKEPTIIFDFNYLTKERIFFLLPEIENSINKLRNLEEYEFSENKIFLQNNVKNYNQKDRFFALISLKDILEKIKEQNPSLKIPQNFFPSVISLFDNYLIKSKKLLKKEELFSALFACSDLIDKEQSLFIFNDPYFQSKFTYEITKEILKAVDLNSFPVKVYDYFDIFYFQMTQVKKNDLEFLEFLKIFKDNFIEFQIYMLFHEDSKIEKPSINFISCLLLSYETTVNILLKDVNIISMHINIYKNRFGYNDDKYLNFKSMISESIEVHNNIINYIMSKIKGNK